MTGFPALFSTGLVFPVLLRTAYVSEDSFPVVLGILAQFQFYLSLSLPDWKTTVIFKAVLFKMYQF